MDGDILHILNDTQFGQKLRGYDPLEVDEVLDAAIEEIKNLRAQAKAATDRATLAEELVESELGPARQNRLEAEEGLATAKEEALSFVETAKKEAEDLTEATEREVRQAVEKGRAKMLAEMKVLDSDRQRMLDDMSIMEKHIEAHRSRLRSALMDLEALVGGIAARPEPAPIPSSSDLPGAGEGEVADDSKPLPQVEEEAAAPEKNLEELPAPEPRVKENLEENTPATPDVIAEEDARIETSSMAQEKPEELLEESESEPNESMGGNAAEYPATEVVAATPPPTELLDELRQSVGGEGEAMDAFFDDDEPPSSLFRRG